jgi:hypothetical protein
MLTLRSDRPEGAVHHWELLVTAAGCDIEVVEVVLGAVQGWSFAFAAFGPAPTRREALLASWQGLLAATTCPESFGPRTAQAMGSPEWLARSFVPDRSFA